MSSGDPAGAGKPVPVMGVTGGPAVLNGTISQEPGSGSLILASNPSNVVQVRKGSSPQSFQVYEYYVSNSDFSRIAINTQAGGPFQIALESQPPGIVRALDIVSNGPVRINGLPIATLPTAQILSVVGATSGPTTNSGVLVDLPDMTLTISAGGGRVIGFATASVGVDTVGQGAVLEYNIDGTLIVPSRRLFTAAIANANSSVTLLHDFGILSIANHTIKIQWQSTGGALATSALQQREMILVEFR